MTTVNSTPFDAMEIPYPTYLDYDSRRLVPGKVETKKVPQKTEQADQPTQVAEQPGQGAQAAQADQTYKDIQLKYNVGSSASPKLSQFLFEGPAVKTFGIKSRPGLSGRIEHTILISLDPAIPELAMLHQTFNQIYNDLSNVLFVNRFAAGFPQLILAAVPSVMKSPVTITYNQETGEPLDKPPAIYAKLYDMKFSKTTFMLPDGTPVEWADLTNASVTLVPLFRFRRIYIGSKPSIQMDLYSAVVLDIQPIQNEAVQLHSCKRYDANLSIDVARKLQEMQAARIKQQQQHPANQLMAPHQEEESQESNQSTFAGLEAPAPIYPAPEFSLETITAAATVEPEPSIPVIPRTLRLPVIKKLQ